VVGRQGVSALDRPWHWQGRQLGRLRCDFGCCPRGWPVLRCPEQPSQHPQWQHRQRLVRRWFASGAVLVGPARRLVDSEAERQVSQYWWSSLRSLR